MPDDLIRVREAARRLGVSYATLKQWIYKGAFRTVQTAGGHHRISESELERFLARKGTRPTKARRAARPPTVLAALSGRNQLRGVVEEVRSDGLMAQIVFQMSTPKPNAPITQETAERCVGLLGD